MSAPRRPLEFPVRFRRRLRLFCTAAVAVATAMFGIGSFLFIRADKLDRFEAMARREARLRATSAARDEAASPERIARMVAEGGRTGAVVAVGGRFASSSPTLRLDDVPQPLLDREGETETASVEGTSYVVVAVDLTGYRVFVFFGRDQVVDEVRTVGEILAGAWLLVVLGAFLVCGRVARRALWPVRRAAEVARDVADGLLDVRIPVEGDDEFSAWAWEFNRMVDELERRIERERRFTADVAHELRTPLGSLATAASLLHGRLQRLPPDARRPAELLLREVRRLRALVDDLLEISRVGTKFDDVDVSDVELRQRVLAVVESRGWGEEVTVEGRAVRVRTDPRRLDRVVANLVDNAIRHGRPPVVVRVVAAGHEASVEIQDRGPGIPSEQRERIFEPFYKGDPSRPGPGSGLGLAIAAEHARALRARIDVDGRPDEGARFVLRLPVDFPEGG